MTLASIVPQTLATLLESILSDADLCGLVHPADQVLGGTDLFTTWARARRAAGQLRNVAQLKRLVGELSGG